MLPAGELAAKIGVEKEWLKLNVRKLKNLGLTVSHQPGYELSLRGREYLRRTRKRAYQAHGSPQRARPMIYRNTNLCPALNSVGMDRAGRPRPALHLRCSVRG